MVAKLKTTPGPDNCQTWEDIPGDVPVSGWSGSELEIREALLRWYDCERRRLPWRGDPPPWSENKAKLRSEAARRESSKRCQPLSKVFQVESLSPGKRRGPSY